MSQHRIGHRRPVAALITLTLTSGTLAGLGVLAAAPAGATPGPACNQPTVTLPAGSAGSYTVPAGATLVSVTASGAKAVDNGTFGSGGAHGGAGATVTTSLSVTPGQALDYTVGTAGSTSSGGLTGTSPSGGGTTPYSGNNYLGSGGGGATFVSTAGVVLVAAGGGGGSGYYSLSGGAAGPGGSTGVTAGSVYSGGNAAGRNGEVIQGGGTTAGAGGPAGSSYGAGFSGSGMLGGSGATSSGAGGGGGGYTGGGGGAFGQGSPQGGGAGSSYSASSYTIVGNGGTGSLTISAPADPTFQSTTSNLFIENQSNTFLVCAPGGPGTVLSFTGTLPTGVTFHDNGDGTATLSGTPTQTGDFALTFTSISSIATEHQSFTLTSHDITAKTLVVTASPSSVTAGGLVSGTITAYDAQGAVATTDQDAISFTDTDLQATVPGGHLVNGAATFSTHLKTVGSQTVTVTDAGISGTSNAVTVTPAAATSYTVVPPSSATAGITVPTTITAMDPYGNIDTNDNGDVTVSSTDSAVTQTPTVTLAAGTVTLPVMFFTAGNQTITANDAGSSGVTGSSSPVSVSAGATTQLVETTATSVTAGSTNSISVQPQDAFGNDTNATDTVHFTSSDPNAVLPADGPVNALGAPLVTLKTAGSQTVTVTDVTNSGVTASTVTVSVVAGPAQGVSPNVGNQQSTPAGHDFGSPLSVLVTDANGNPVANQSVTFTSPGGVLATFGGAATTVAVTNSAGIATAGVLTAGGTPGDVTITASAMSPGFMMCPPFCPPSPPVTLGSTAFTETVTASDAAVAAVAKTSSGVGIDTQSTQVVLPAGITMTLLDAAGAPATTVYNANGTYVLDPTTGLINFVAVDGFVGTALPVTYQLTDGFNFTATSTYTPTVTAPAPVVPPANPVAPPVAPPTPAPAPVSAPLGVAHVSSAARTVLTGSTVPATCSVTVATIGTCRTALTARVSGRQVVLGTSSMVKASAGSSKVKTVIHLNRLGRALAAQVGGVQATTWASVTKSDGRVLSTKVTVLLVDKHVVVPAAVLFLSKQTTLTSTAHRQLKALKADLGPVSTITCIGYADARGNAVTNAALGKARATTVCAALAKHGVKRVMVTKGDAHPVASNATAAGQALNRRVEITLTY